MITDVDINDYKELMNDSDKDQKDDFKLYAAFALTGLISGLSFTKTNDAGEVSSSYPLPSEVCELATQYAKEMISRL